MNNDVIKIGDLLDKIEKDGYIDCNRDDPFDGEMYESILFYLKFCQGWFMVQAVDKFLNKCEEK